MLQQLQFGSLWLIAPAASLLLAALLAFSLPLHGDDPGGRSFSQPLKRLILAGMLFTLLTSVAVFAVVLGVTGYLGWACAALCAAASAARARWLAEKTAPIERWGLKFEPSTRRILSGLASLSLLLPLVLAAQMILFVIISTQMQTRLRGSVELLQRSCGPLLAQGYFKDNHEPPAFEEELLRRMAQAPQVSALRYYDGYEVLRWSQGGENVGRRKAVVLAKQRAAAVLVPLYLNKPTAWELAFPVTVAGRIVGILDIEASPEGLRGLAAAAPQLVVAAVKVANEPPPAPPPAGMQGPTEKQRQSRQHYLAGVIDYQKGDFARARQEWSLARQLDPGNAEAQAGLERLPRER